MIEKKSVQEMEETVEKNLRKYNKRQNIQK